MLVYGPFSSASLTASSVSVSFWLQPTEFFLLFFFSTLVLCVDELILRNRDVYGVLFFFFIHIVFVLYPYFFFC